MKTVENLLPMEQLLPLIEDGFQEGLSVTLGVTGNSMYPLLRHKRDSVVLAPCDKYALKRGDLPLYRRQNGQFVLHRIVRVEKDSYTLVGDAQTELEIGLPKENILAVVTGINRKGKFFPVTNRRYRLYVRFWMAIRPLRPLYFWASRVKNGVSRRLRRWCGSENAADKA